MTGKMPVPPIPIRARYVPRLRFPIQNDFFHHRTSFVSRTFFIPSEVFRVE
jgi:hypothetical protein